MESKKLAKCESWRYHYLFPLTLTLLFVINHVATCILKPQASTLTTLLDRDQLRKVFTFFPTTESASPIQQFDITSKWPQWALSYPTGSWSGPVSYKNTIQFILTPWITLTICSISGPDPRRVRPPADTDLLCHSIRPGRQAWQTIQWNFLLHEELGFGWKLRGKT